MCRRDHRHQSNAGGLSVREGAIICGLFWSIGIWHREIETRLNCHVLGRRALCDFIIARSMPVLRALFLRAAQRGFRTIWNLAQRTFGRRRSGFRKKMRSFSDLRVF